MRGLERQQSGWKAQKLRANWNLCLFLTLSQDTWWSAEEASLLPLVDAHTPSSGPGGNKGRDLAGLAPAPRQQREAADGWQTFSALQNGHRTFCPCRMVFEMWSCPSVHEHIRSMPNGFGQDRISRTLSHGLNVSTGILDRNQWSCKYQGPFGIEEMSYRHFGEDHMSCKASRLATRCLRCTNTYLSTSTLRVQWLLISFCLLNIVYFPGGQP